MAEVTETARARVQALAEHWDWPDPAILDDILTLGDEAVPALEELLTPELLAFARTEEREDSVVYYAMTVLSASRLPDALRLLIRLFAQVDDELLDALPDYVYPFGEAAIDPLLTLTADETLGWYPRAIAAEVAANLAGEDEAATRRIADLIRPIVTDYLARFEELNEVQRQVLSALAGELANLTDAEARPMLEQALAEGKIDPDELDQEFLEELYRDGRYLPPRPLLDALDRYREDWHRYQEAAEVEKRLAVFKSEPTSQPVVLSPKIGRNDPCWCGSGKKYKKCHLAQDEKEKVRL